jgi:hypothetical protein
VNNRSLEISGAGRFSTAFRVSFLAIIVLTVVAGVVTTLIHFREPSYLMPWTVVAIAVVAGVWAISIEALGLRQGELRWLLAGTAIGAALILGLVGTSSIGWLVVGGCLVSAVLIFWRVHRNSRPSFALALAGGASLAVTTLLAAQPPGVQCRVNGVGLGSIWLNVASGEGSQEATGAFGRLVTSQGTFQYKCSNGVLVYLHRTP